MKLKYSILGAGAMGSAFGARLRLAGFDVELLNRSAQHSAAIKANGLWANIDGKRHTIDIAATTLPHASPADVIILLTKSHQIESALQSMPDALRNTPVVTLQNGLGNGAKVAAQVGIENTLEGVSMMPADLIGPGEVTSSDAAHTWLYHASGEHSTLVEQIGADFNQAGISATVSPDVTQFIWRKACFNIAMNALCGLTQGSPGLLHQFPDGQTLAHELADEALQVATASGVSLDGTKVHELIDYACKHHTYHKPSMLQDLEHGRLTEIEALNGYIVAQADKLGIDIPLNQMMLRLIRLREQSAGFWRSH